MLQVKYYIFAGVAELADASDLKSGGNLFPCRFEPDPRHHFFHNFCGIFYLRFKFDFLAFEEYNNKK